ncbi:hypothetical protein JUM001_07590 [Clostridium perfringens]|nr:hypothetical protein JUM001_07590 [Clostridium perfringens]
MNNIITPPKIIIIFLLVLKNELKALIDEPNIKNVVDIPKVKNNVFLIKTPLLKLESLMSSTLLLDNILKYIGTIGNIHGEKIDKIPSIKTIKKLIFSTKPFPLYFYLSFTG